MTARTTALWLCSLLLWGFGLSLACGEDYYVDPAGGDRNLGTEASPWRNISRVNQADLEPGDCIHFQGGERFVGTLEFDRDDSGAPGKEIVVTSYGRGRAIIEACDGSAVKANECDHFIIRDIDMVGSGRKAGNTADGVCIVNSQSPQVDHVEISGFRGSGLLVDGVRDAKVAYVYAHDNGSAGISVGHCRRSARVHIEHCVADNNAGDPSNLTNHSGNGIVAGNADDVLIEYCEASNNGWDMPRQGNGPVGIWAWDCNHAVIRFCISHDNKSPGDDGGGFDLDGGAVNSICQYNLSYHNEGPGYFLCQYPGAPDFKNNIIRYNISYNDGVKNNRRSGIDVFSASPNAWGCQVYNNTVYNENGPAVGFGGLPMPDVVFRNNVFVCAGPVIGGDAPRGRFENNVYWPADHQPLSFDGYASLAEWALATGQEKIGGTVVGKCTDPKLVRADSTMPTEPAKLADLTAYKLQSDSPCLNAGVLIKDNGGRDFWGRPVPQDARPAVGACERP
jgi:hypothetical protein